MMSNPSLAPNPAMTHEPNTKTTTGQILSDAFQVAGANSMSFLIIMLICLSPAMLMGLLEALGMAPNLGTLGNGTVFSRLTSA